MLKERNATLPMAIYAVDAVHLDIKCNTHLKCLLLLKSLVVCAGRKDAICFDSASLDYFKFTTSILRESLNEISFKNLNKVVSVAENKPEKPKMILICSRYMSG